MTRKDFNELLSFLYLEYWLMMDCGSLAFFGL